MRKIDFSKIEEDIAHEYLLALELVYYDTAKKQYLSTKKYNKLQEKWNAQKDKCIKFKKLKENDLLENDDIKSILTLDYEKMMELYINVERLEKPKKDKEGNIIKDNDKEEIEILNEIFNYNNYYPYIQKFFNKYIKKLDLYTCPYCETAYTGFFETNNDESKNEQVNYDLDHFIPKSYYPMFALSLYNFIPSCQMCNQRIKNNDDLKEIYGKTKNSLLKVSPVSENYSFDTEVKIQYIPKIDIKEKRDNTTENSDTVYLDEKYNIIKDITKAKFEYKYFHYAPITQEKYDDYEVYFKTNNSLYRKMIEKIKLKERYDSIAIKNVGLYLLDLKKQFPDTYINMISNILISNGIYESPQKIFNNIFHVDEKNQLLKKMRKDILD